MTNSKQKSWKSKASWHRLARHDPRNRALLPPARGVTPVTIGGNCATFHPNLATNQAELAGLSLVASPKT